MSERKGSLDPGEKEEDAGKQKDYTKMYLSGFY